MLTARMGYISLQIPDAVRDRFGRVAAGHGHGKEKGVVLAAAILAFEASSHEQQDEWVRRAMDVKREEYLAARQGEEPDEATRLAIQAAKKGRQARQSSPRSRGSDSA